MVTVYFACGHHRAATSEAEPRCPCGERRVRRTVLSRPVRVTGKVLAGPIATPTAVEPMGTPYRAPETNRVTLPDRVS